MFRGMPFLADILLKIYNTIGVNWERAGNIRYSVICKGGENLDPVTAQERGKAVAAEWSRAMEDNKNGTVRDFVAVGDVEIKVIGGIPRPRCGRSWSSWWQKPGCRPFCWG